ncbi:hypothetical protein BKN37_05810 [Mycobacterium talmoniae]|uniref:Uncharacterized protein n=1 Tax=Mycobacterium talmoniae TaxID=1858794 RepID=A0A1S1NHX6_9MYCO|nr:hypothetical protein BKN37_05810 [Mycobacterium talmoniae]
MFRQLVAARIIEPTSKVDSLRAIEEAGITPVTYPTLNRRLPMFAKPSFRQGISSACAAHAQLGPTSLVLSDVSTLFFETDAEIDEPHAGGQDPRWPAGRAIPPPT